MKNHKFTWIDGLVIAVIVLLIAGTCLKFFVLDSTNIARGTVPLSYQIEILGIRQFSVDMIQVGDTVYDDEGKGAVGVITDIEVSPAETTTTFPDGTARRVPVEDRFDVTLTLSANAMPDGDAYKIGTYQMQVNRSTLYFTKFSTWYARVISIAEQPS